MDNIVKLIIWDLDDTLWTGSIMVEDSVTPHENLINSIRELNNRGIVNSICSNNYFDFCMDILRGMNIDDLFIMPNINYNSKGVRIKRMIEDFQLRPENVLFVDDNPFNLTEVKHYNSNIQTIDGSDTKSVQELLNKLISNNEIDKKSRFEKYKILENKVSVSKEYDNNEDFLRSSEIKVYFDYDIENKIDRVYELVHRTNQLNYTKNRKSKEDLLLDVQNNKSFIVSVKDKYGDYGEVGFISHTGNNVSHFTFSCRILNMGVTDFVYAKIGQPNITIEGVVAVELSKVSPDWISETKEVIKKKEQCGEGSILFVGGCDLESTTKYLEQTHNIDKHFNYQANGTIIHRDSIEYLTYPDFNDDDLEYILSTVPFIDKKTFEKPDYNNYDIVVYSPLIDYIQGKYKSNRFDNFVISCNPFFHEPWDDTSLTKFSKKRNIPKGKLEVFSQNWEPIVKTDSEYETQLNDFFKKLSHCSKVIIILGATTTYSDLDNDKYLRHIKNNTVIRKVSRLFSNIELIDIDKIITDRNDFTNAIRHYSPLIYKRISDEIIKKL